MFGYIGGNIGQRLTFSEWMDEIDRLYGKEQRREFRLEDWQLVYHFGVRPADAMDELKQARKWSFTY